MYDPKDYYYDDEHSKTNMRNTVTNHVAFDFTCYFHYKYNLHLTTTTYTKDLNEVFFMNGNSYVRALGKLCQILEDNNIAYKEYWSAISIKKEDLYNLASYIKMQGEWRDEWTYFK